MAAPSNDDVQHTWSKSHKLWHSYAQEARSQARLSPDIIKPRNLLHGVPALPNNCRLATAIAKSRSLVVQGQAIWKFIRQADCNLQEEIVVPRELTIGISQPTTCMATQSSFRNWTDHVANGHEACESGNYLAILILAWAYIFSKGHVEKQGESMHYSDFSAPIVNNQLDDAEAVGLFVDVGQVDAAEARWWEAVLAPGQGWHAVVSGPTYLSPWSVTYQGGPRFVVKVSTILPSVRDSDQSHPPSSEQAFEYLSRFCALHDVGDQASAALTATLILPLHNSLGRPAQLPVPNLLKARRIQSEKPAFGEERHDLPYYLTLSCTASMLGSVIWGVFWEPDVDCNLVSPWFSPILEVLTPITEAGDHEMLLKVLALHRPKLAPLWLGAILTGFTTFIIPFLRSLNAPYARPDPIASVWTGSSQSFMDLQGSGPYAQDDDEMQRADRWRLLHDVANLPYKSTPLVGWQPFGRMPLASTELEVYAHARCERHKRHYSNWRWFLADGSIIEDCGFKNLNDSWNLFPISQCPLSEINDARTNQRVEIEDWQASEAATREIFAWPFVGGEGHGRSEAEIYKHPWVADLLDNDTDCSDSSGASSNDNELKDFQADIINRFLSNTPDSPRAKTRVRADTL